MDIEKELESFPIGAYLGVKLLGDWLCIHSFVKSNAKSSFLVFAPEDKICIYSSIKQVFMEHIIQRARLSQSAHIPVENIRKQVNFKML